MRVVISMYVAILLLVMSSGTLRAASSLADMSKAIDELGRYEVFFILSINGGEEAVDGYYIVDGERFFLSIADQQIYGDGAQRCSINHHQREVVLERIPDNGSQPLVIVNPVSAFTELAEEFDVEEFVQTDGDVAEDLSSDVTTLHLTPKKADAIVASSRIEIDNTTNLPRSISYVAESDEVSLVIIKIEKTDEQFEVIYPEGYEVIDIR